MQEMQISVNENALDKVMYFYATTDVYKIKENAHLM